MAGDLMKGEGWDLNRQTTERASSLALARFVTSPWSLLGWSESRTSAQAAVAAPR